MTHRCVSIAVLSSSACSATLFGAGQLRSTACSAPPAVFPLGQSDRHELGELRPGFAGDVSGVAGGVRLPCTAALVAAAMAAGQHQKHHPGSTKGCSARGRAPAYRPYRVYTTCIGIIHTYTELHTRTRPAVTESYPRSMYRPPEQGEYRITIKRRGVLRNNRKQTGQTPKILQSSTSRNSYSL